MGTETENVRSEIIENYLEPEPQKVSTKYYFKTRISTLKPRMTKVPNPFTLLASLSCRQWLFFLCAFLSWTWDAFDFFTVSLTVQPLAKQFHKTNAEITWGITLVLMFRSVGAIIFGLLSDRYGRKWPFIMNNFLFIVLELATGFTSTYSSFLACRALFGIAMGGLYGNAAALALEDAPVEARGILSGMFQCGYSFGYLLATAFARALVGTTSYGWRPLFWFGACPPVLIMVFRLCLPETTAYMEREKLRDSTQHATRTFIEEGKLALKHHWLMCFYMVLLMSGFNFMGHGSLDLYPTLLTNQFQFSPDALTVTQVVGNLGAISGAITIGHVSEIFGRRLTVIIACIVGGALLYPYTFVSTTAVMACAFFLQFCIQGSFGVVPTHLAELSPGSIRSFMIGTSYQLGNLASSASSTIEATIGEEYPLPPSKNGVKRYDYGLVICIFLGCAVTFVLILVVLGPEKKDISLGVAQSHVSENHSVSAIATEPFSQNEGV